jgi:membrane-bound lytic murein transglycosylase A
MRGWTRIAAALACALLSGCYGIQVSFERPARPPFRELSRPALPADDLDLPGLRRAARASQTYFQRSSSSKTRVLGDDVYTSEQVARSVERFMELVENTPPGQLGTRLARDCRAYAPRDGGLFTAYYEPILQASRERTPRFRYPLYAKPDGLTLVKLARFFPGDSRQFHGQLKGGELLPYLTREQIDGRRMLAGRGLELAWLDDPVSVFFLHIQGSGRLHLDDGDVLRVNYSASNGLPYTSIGRYLLNEKMIRSGSSDSIQAFLRGNPSSRDDIMFRNRRYIFFREVDLGDDEGPIGSLGVPLVAGRSVAADQRYVPPGAVMFIKTDAPVVGTDGQLAGWNKIARFAFNHDSGAAIKGPGRADIYWGEGAAAGAAAGYMHNPGDMIVLMCGVQPQPAGDVSGRTASAPFQRVAWPEFARVLATTASSGL